MEGTKGRRNVASVPLVLRGPYLEAIYLSCSLDSTSLASLGPLTRELPFTRIQNKWAAHRSNRLSLLFQLFQILVLDHSTLRILKLFHWKLFQCLTESISPRIFIHSQLPESQRDSYRTHRSLLKSTFAQFHARTPNSSRINAEKAWPKPEERGIICREKDFYSYIIVSN